MRREKNPQSGPRFRKTRGLLASFQSLSGQGLGFSTPKLASRGCQLHPRVPEALLLDSGKPPQCRVPPASFQTPAWVSPEVPHCASFSTFLFNNNSNSKMWVLIIKGNPSLLNLYHSQLCQVKILQYCELLRLISGISLCVRRHLQGPLVCLATFCNPGQVLPYLQSLFRSPGMSRKGDQHSLEQFFTRQ